MEPATLAAKPSLTLTRRFPVAPEKVWRAWTEPQALKQWFGPGGPQPVAVAEADVRVGGRFRIVFGGAQGTDHEVQGVYREVIPNRRLVFTWTWPRSTPERESLVTVELRAVGEDTELVFRHEQLFDEAARDGHLRGWSETFVKLERYVTDSQ
ncbi:MAG: SRPBCC domain-containing protein [Burkholderiales bacterium]|nr:SRPBCC domain-containing protein [Burkholderiales bacterium]